MISKITALTYTSSFDGKFGPMCVFNIAFENGEVGQVNAKSDPPPYKVGDEMEITQTGEFQGTKKFKVKKADADNFKTVPNQRFEGNDAPRQSQPSQQAPSAPNGARTGMIINNAIALMIAQNTFSVSEAYKAVDLVTAITDYAENPKTKSEPVTVQEQLDDDSTDVPF